LTFKPYFFKLFTTVVDKEWLLHLVAAIESDPQAAVSTSTIRSYQPYFDAWKSIGQNRREIMVKRKEIQRQRRRRDGGVLVSAPLTPAPGVLYEPVALPLLGRLLRQERGKIVQKIKKAF
jgi:hypothetical protein